ncbi:Por secretion system C-terminal sorting domain-containing protein [Chitinophaga jiangningensis]|uniref:Por secretion system C-terminal sorting domain-containing protein n=1 Tax=Chitinophaga jiangningensis TaxID=1419482 RepID=A0A1M7LTJ5_9BACT|nr:T9SS type A sorting domain-containing protein [Chitinophaga jiangningensis]SHM81635.1 Por secretion system C-terminal sorting domain-containing protein [Chitinophaga jiangningensis]
MKQFYLLILLLLYYKTGTGQQYATSQTNGITGICLLCNVANPNNAIDNNDLGNYSSLNITAGLLGVTVFQTLIFPATAGGSCDSLFIGVGTSGSISVNLLGGISVQTYLGTSANNDLQVVDSSHFRFTGTNTGEILLRPVGTFDRVKITFTSSLAGLLTSLRLFYAGYKPAVPTPAATDSIAICSGDSATVSAVPPAGATVSWYSAPSGGTLLHTGNSYTFTPPATVTVYAIAGIGSCSSAPKPVTVIVNPLPAKPVYSVPQGRQCNDQSLVISNHTTGLSYSVNVNYTGSGNLNKDTSFTVQHSNTITIKDLGYYFNATASISIRAINDTTGCISDSTNRAFIFGGHAARAVVTGDSAIICKGDSVTLNANLLNDPSGTNLALIKWYDTPVNGTLLYTGHNFKSKPDTTVTYYVTAAFECDYPVRTPAKVIVKKLALPDFTVPQGVACGVQQLPLNNRQPGYYYAARFVYRSFLGVMKDTSYYSYSSQYVTTPPIFPILPVDVLVYLQAIDSVSGCKSDTAQMTYSMGGYALQPSTTQDSVQICNGSAVTLHSYIPGFNDPTVRFRWYSAATGGTLLSSADSLVVSPLGTTTYYASAGYECQFPARTPVTVVVSDCNALKGQALQSVSLHPRTITYDKGIYPNPTTGTIFLDFKQDITGSLLQIFDINGRELLREVLASNRFNFQNRIPSGGLYLVKVSRNNEVIYQQKIILK